MATGETRSEFLSEGRKGPGPFKDRFQWRDQETGSGTDAEEQDGGSTLTSDGEPQRGEGSDHGTADVATQLRELLNPRGPFIADEFGHPRLHPQVRGPSSFAETLDPCQGQESGQPGARQCIDRGTEGPPRGQVRPRPREIAK